jgi:hypothetical protein
MITCGDREERVTETLTSVDTTAYLPGEHFEATPPVVDSSRPEVKRIGKQPPPPNPRRFRLPGFSVVTHGAPRPWDEKK